MHCLIAILYGLAIWLALVLYTAATHGDLVLVTALGPFIVSGAALGLMALDAAIAWLVDRADAAEEGHRDPAE